MLLQHWGTPLPQLPAIAIDFSLNGFFINGDSIVKQYFSLPFNVLKYFLIYTLKVVHVLGILDPGTPPKSSIATMMQQSEY